jgi:hypothetical protein
MKIVYALVALVAYILAIKLPVGYSATILGVFSVLCMLGWLASVFNFHSLLSSATTGEPIESSSVTLPLFISAVVGWSVGYLLINKSALELLINLVTP